MQSHPLSLREYQEHLIERIRATAHSQTASSHLGFEVGSQLWAVPLTEISEVIPVSPLTAVPLTQTWFMGLANVRGSLYAVTDIACFMGGMATPLTPDCRLVLLHTRYRAHAALLIRRSLGLRQLRDSTVPESGSCSWESGRYRDADGETWHELTVKKLVKESRFLNAAAS